MLSYQQVQPDKKGKRKQRPLKVKKEKPAVVPEPSWVISRKPFSYGPTRATLILDVREEVEVSAVPDVPGVKEFFYKKDMISLTTGTGLPTHIMLKCWRGCRVWTAGNVCYYGWVKEEEKPKVIQVELGEKVAAVNVTSERQQAIDRSASGQSKNPYRFKSAKVVLEPEETKVAIEIALNERVISGRRWAIAIPSGEGKTTLARKYPGLFVDSDALKATVPESERLLRKYSRGSKSGVNERESTTGKVLLVQAKSNAPADAVFLGTFLLCECVLTHPHIGGELEEGATPWALRLNTEFRRIAVNCDDEVMYCKGYTQRDTRVFNKLYSVGFPTSEETYF